MVTDDLPIPPTRLLEESPNGWLLTDSHGVIRFANARASELFGYSREELLGQPVELLLPQGMQDIHLQHRANYMEQPQMRPMGLGMELTAQRKDRSEFPVEISLSPMHTSHGIYVTAVVRDISERVRLEEEHNALRVELEMGRERDRIGMDLHDGIMQEIYAAGLSLELALADLRERPDAAEAGIERTIAQLHEVILDIRSYIFDLRPREYSGKLIGALAELVREFRQNTQIEVTEDIPDVSVEVNEQCASAVYHIVHEALSNVRKHAHASQVSLTVSLDGKGMTVKVEDNGRGFDAQVDLPQAHRGLRNMAARARSTSCELKVDSAPDEGTRVIVHVPARAPA